MKKKGSGLQIRLFSKALLPRTILNEIASFLLSKNPILVPQKPGDLWDSFIVQHVWEQCPWSNWLVPEAYYWEFLECTINPSWFIALSKLPFSTPNVINRLKNVKVMLEREQGEAMDDSSSD